MVFNFNKFVDWYIKSSIKKAEKKIIIHTWFAWHPVKVSDYKWVWLELVLREHTSNNYWNMPFFEKRYKSPLYYELEEE